jgi:hypothetical protein
MATDCGKGISLNGDYFFAPLVVGGKIFHFSPKQTRFVYLLKKGAGDLALACKEVGWTVEEATKFFSCRKWNEYLELLKAQVCVSKGEIRSEWWDFVTDGMRGFRELWVGACELCHEEYSLAAKLAEQYRDDDMQMKFTCRVCKGPVALTFVKEEFHPNREQVQCAGEIGARVEPKVERKINEFSDETYVWTEAV